MSNERKTENLVRDDLRRLGYYDETCSTRVEENNLHFWKKFIASKYRQTTDPVFFPCKYCVLRPRQVIMGQ